jgi:putative membrane protein insertion efficiency factor
MKGPKSLQNQVISENSGSLNYEFYKKYISPVSGKQCQMYPNCSNYARQAFQKHGFLSGFIFMADRLTRCGSDLSYYKIILENHKFLYDDPVPKTKLFEKHKEIDNYNMSDYSEWN